MKKILTYLSLIILSMSVVSCGSDKCEKIRDRAHEEAIITDYLSHPTVDNSMDFDGRMMVSFTNTSDCYIFDIDKIGIYYIRPWDSARKSKHININLTISPNDTRTVEIPVPRAANILNAFSLMANTKVRLKKNK